MKLVSITCIISVAIGMKENRKYLQFGTVQVPNRNQFCTQIHWNQLKNSWKHVKVIVTTCLHHYLFRRLNYEMQLHQHGGGRCYRCPFCRVAMT